jgi:hypothetical protein
MANVETCPIIGGAPEDILVLPNGDVITGTIDGRLQKIRADFSGADTVVQMSQRALGMDLMLDGRVVFCDPNGGVYAVDVDTGVVETLATEFEGQPLGVCNNPSVAADGMAYFSVSTTRRDVFNSVSDIIENIPTGALYRIGADGAVEKLLGDLLFANGVVVAPDQQSVLVAETGTAKIHRVWIDGDKAGSAEVFVEGMLGMPDNLALADDGTLLVAWPSPFDKRVQDILALPAFVRKLIVMLPNFLKPKAADRLMFARYDFDGRLLGAVDCAGAGYHFVTGGRQVGDWVYVGSVEEDAVARFPFAELA